MMSSQKVIAIEKGLKIVFLTPLFFICTTFSCFCQQALCVSGFATMGTSARTSADTFAAEQVNASRVYLTHHAKGVKDNPAYAKNKALLLPWTIAKIKRLKPLAKKGSHKKKGLSNDSYRASADSTGGGSTFCSGAGICSTNLSRKDDAVSIPMTFCISTDRQFISIGFRYSDLIANQDYELPFIDMTEYIFDADYPLSDPIFMPLGLPEGTYIPRAQPGTISRGNTGEVIIIMPLAR